MDLLVKGTAHTPMKMIGGKITVKTSATFDIGRLTKSLRDDDHSAVFCQQVLRCILATLRVSLDRERYSYVPRKA